MDDFKNVLDKGYVRLVDHMGSDVTPTNAARVSYNKSTDHLRDKDKGLINFLGRNNETSPFRHAMLQFEVYAPLMVGRQWWKYVVGSDHQLPAHDTFAAWNESSRRYVTEEPTFYIPADDKWRSKPQKGANKQGSGEPVDHRTGFDKRIELEAHIDDSLEMYYDALEKGVAPEQARLFLPAYAMYIRWYWTASLAGVAHFIAERDDNHAQYEIRQYAQAVRELTVTKFPHSLEALLQRGDQ